MRALATVVFGTVLGLSVGLTAGGWGSTTFAQDATGQKAKLPDPPKQSTKSAAAPVKQTATAEQLRQALERSVTFDFQETPLSDVVEFLREFAGINILLDGKGLHSAGIDLDHRVTLNLRNVPLKEALDFLLSPIDVRYMVRSNVLVLTDHETASRQELRVYPVADLVLVKGDGSQLEDIAVDFIQLIFATVDPDRWQENGGDNNIHYHAPTCSLVASCSESVHSKLEGLFKELRQVQRKHASLYEGQQVPSLEMVHKQLALRIHEQQNQAAKSSATAKGPNAPTGGLGGTK